MVRPKKHLGQHFLTDLNTAQRIVESMTYPASCNVMEIGPGKGVLTQFLIKKEIDLKLVELDIESVEYLKSNFDLNKMEVISADVLKIPFSEVFSNQSFSIIGNFPYNISSQIIVQLIKSRGIVSRTVLMFQKELAQRITAQPGCKDYGRLTVMLGYCADIKKLADIKASLFFPKPKVDSVVLEIKFKPNVKYPANNEAFLFRVIKAAFSKRRKTLKNALAGSELHIDAKTALHVLESINIKPVRRAETLTVQEFVKLSNLLENLIGLKTIRYI